MTRLRSQSLVTQLRSLFAGGTLAGLGEGELLDRFVGARDEPAFEELVARHGPMVLAVCRRWLADPEDVEDAFQATFLVLVRKAGSLRDRQSVGPWLYGVAHRVARQARASALRRRDREMRVIEHRAPSGQAAEPDPSDELAGREVIGAIEAEILRLPEKHRSAAVLCLVQGQSHEAAARALGWPLGTLKTRIAEARA
ncbi:MAG: RNA polymerase sigma factor, partial [Isosphaeraceae bacterium]